MRFLITGYPRSGTKYTAEVFQALGHQVLHEKEGKTGVVSFRHFENYMASKKMRKRIIYSPIIHQVRHPLEVMKSAHKMMYWSWKSIYRYLRGFPHEDPMLRAMFAWCAFNELIEQHAIWRFQVEQIYEVYPELFKKLGLPVPDGIPDVKRTMNTKKEYSHYIHDLTWDDLEKKDKPLTDKMKGMAERYGYGI